MQLPRLAFSPWTPRLRGLGEEVQIFDSIRQQWVVLTPEEWVRQSLLQHLTGQLGYARGLLMVERRVEVNQLSQRADVVAMDRQGAAFLLVECKAPHIALSEDTILQALRYNARVGASWVGITNGRMHRVYHRLSPREPFRFTGDQFPPYPPREASPSPLSPCPTL